MELAFRNRIAMVKDPNRRKYPLADRYIEVVSEKLTGEVLLDEALKMINSTQERMSVGQWIDLMSGKSRYSRCLEWNRPRRLRLDCSNT